MEEIQVTKIFGITIVRHHCIDKMLTGKGCSFHHKWAHAHYFTLFDKIRIVIGTPRADTKQEKLEKLR